MVRRSSMSLSPKTLSLFESCNDMSSFEQR